MHRPAHPGSHATCRPGSYADVTGLAACKSCATAAGFGAETCTLCAAGEFAGAQRLLFCCCCCCCRPAAALPLLLRCYIRQAGWSPLGLNAPIYVAPVLTFLPQMPPPGPAPSAPTARSLWPGPLAPPSAPSAPQVSARALEPFSAACWLHVCIMVQAACLHYA